MFPEPVAIAIRDPQAADAPLRTSVTAELTARTGSESEAAASPNQIQAALRIRAALRAAHQDAREDPLPHGQWHEWTWTVKAAPRPPLMVGSMEELNGEDLLANDSMGG